jgi:hypothetical protein
VTTGVFRPQDPFSSKDFYFTQGWELVSLFMLLIKMKVLIKVAAPM